jgi:small-conductance mechanosensitive channel
MVSVQLSQAQTLPAEGMVPTQSPSYLAEFTPPGEYLEWLRRLPQLTEPQRIDLRRALLTKFIKGHAQRSRVENLKRNLTERVEQARLLGGEIRATQMEIKIGSQQLPHFCSDPSKAEAGGSLGKNELLPTVELSRMRLEEMLKQLRSLKEQVEYLEKVTREVTSVMQTQFDQWWNHATSTLA